MLLATGGWPLKFDLYLLKFNKGSDVPPHIDKVEDGEHFRLNLILWAARKGGNFFCEHTVFESKRIKLFRPDLYTHSVTEIKHGVRIVLSLGWIRSSS